MPPAASNGRGRESFRLVRTIGMHERSFAAPLRRRQPNNRAQHKISKFYFRKEHCREDLLPSDLKSCSQFTGRWLIALLHTKTCKCLRDLVIWNKLRRVNGSILCIVSSMTYYYYYCLIRRGINKYPSYE